MPYVCKGVCNDFRVKTNKYFEGIVKCAACVCFLPWCPKCICCGSRIKEQARPAVQRSNSKETRERRKLKYAPRM